MKSNLIVAISLLTSSLIDDILASCCHKEVDYQFLEIITYEHCEGKDAGNYTLINQFTRDSRCDLDSNMINQRDLLLSCSHNSKETNVNMIKILASQTNPNGALDSIDILYLVTGGPLWGKYVYMREVINDPQYLKICSSILGYGYYNSKSNTLLISDKLDLNVLISPTGAFELFKKGCTTICHGNAIGVGPTAIINKTD